MMHKQPSFFVVVLLVWVIFGTAGSAVAVRSGDDVKTLSRPPATPTSRLVGSCLLGLGMLAAALGTARIVDGRLRWVVVFWALAVLLIWVGLTEVFFGDGPVSSALCMLYIWAIW